MDTVPKKPLCEVERLRILIREYNAAPGAFNGKQLLEKIATIGEDVCDCIPHQGTDTPCVRQVRAFARIALPKKPTEVMYCPHDDLNSARTCPWFDTYGQDDNNNCCHWVDGKCYVFQEK